MRGRWLVLFVVFLACQNDFFPEGLYDYQVERLLSNDSSKVWNQVVNSSECLDSIRLLIEALPNSTEDSLAISSLNPQADCAGFDTLFIGNANVSGITESLRSTDSILFADGNYWIIEFISSKNLTIVSEDIVRYMNE